MGLSASRLGQRIGLTAEQMNVLLLEEGFLKGEPGNYQVTEKGKPYVYENGADNGYGGYAFRGWNWYEWDESILEQLNLDSKRLQEIREHTSEKRRIRREESKARSEEYWKSVNAKKSLTSKEGSIDPDPEPETGGIIAGLIKYFLKSRNN